MAARRSSALHRYAAVGHLAIVGFALWWESWALPQVLGVVWPVAAQVVVGLFLVLLWVSFGWLTWRGQLWHAVLSVPLNLGAGLIAALTALQELVRTAFGRNHPVEVPVPIFSWFVALAIATGGLTWLAVARHGPSGLKQRVDFFSGLVVTVAGVTFVQLGGGIHAFRFGLNWLSGVGVVLLALGVAAVIGAGLGAVRGTRSKSPLPPPLTAERAKKYE